MDYKQGLTGIPECLSSTQVFELGTTGAHMRHIDAKWGHIKSLLDPNWKCPFCGFLSFGFTGVEQLRAGVKSGRHCCNIVWDAVYVWHQEEGGSLDIRVFPWHPGPTYQKGQYIHSNILLRWPEKDDEELITIFRSKGSAIEEIGFLSRVPFIQRSLTSGDTSSEEAVSTIRQWLHTCSNQHHRYCVVNEQCQLPKRVLELTEGAFTLRENLTKDENYACLSHCWGPKGPPFMLTEDTWESLTAGLSSKNLPRTFRDAMKLCLRLGIRYLWIDALCIIQQDEDDWKQAAGTMARIYENALFTIAATRSSDSEGGCFSRLQGLEKATRLKSSGLYACKPRWRDFPNMTSTEAGPWPLLRRAWVFQERLLSLRFIHFTDYQMVWECRSMQESETGDISTDWTKRNRFSGFRRPFKFPYKSTNLAWQHVVVEYSRLQLTYPSDRLAAIAAIAERTMRTRNHDDYVAGMWRSSLLYDAVWYRPTNTENLGRRDNRHPTWSWASVSGAVEFHKVSLLPSAELLSVQYTAVGPSHIGEVHNANVSLKGPMLTTTLRSMSTAHTHSLQPKLPTEYENLGRKSWLMKPDFDLSMGERPVEPGDSLTILFLWYRKLGAWNRQRGAWYGLVLRRISHIYHERIGLASIWDNCAPEEMSFDASSEQPRPTTCADLMNSLCIKEFKIV